MVEKEKPQEKTETTQADVSPEMTDAESNEFMEKILNVFKTNEIPAVENKEQEYLEKLQRQQAEFENFRKRTEKEKQEIITNANANLISELLPVLDHFELALKHNKDKGITMIYEELNDILKTNGVKVIDTKGIFNPRLHEGVLTAEGDKGGVILEEIQKGYLLNDKLLRASKVKVSKVKDKK